MEIKKPPTLQEGATPPPASTALGGDWLHEIKQWYFTGGRRLAQDHQPARFVASKTAAPPLEDANPEAEDGRTE